MSTSDRMLAIEATIGSALIVGGVVAVAPHDVWLQDLGLHPAWLAVIVMAARYGPRGLFTALATTWGSFLALGLALGGTLDGFSARLHGDSDLLALGVAILVAWVAMMHESRLIRATSRLEEATGQQRRAEDTIRALHDGLSYLRTRHDRLDISLSLWRNLAGRIERGDDGDAAIAALELCELRVGAPAGSIQLRDGNRLSVLGWRGQAATPRDINGDATVLAAMHTRRVTTATAGSAATDSVVATPIMVEGSGVVIGVIALTGVAPESLRAADLRDLSVIANWLAPVLARSLQAAMQRRRVTEQRRCVGEGQAS